MAIESPLFQSSMELLGHAITHFNGEKELDRKLVILHLANAIELIFKDMVLDLNESIYKGPKETITIHGCIKIILDKGVNIPYHNKIELLVDERNALQHRFGSPNELTTIFYMNIVVDFFKEILSKHYDQEYVDVISQFVEERDLLALKLREPKNENELEKLKDLSKIHPLGALLSATAYLERIISKFIDSLELENSPFIGRFMGGMSHRALLRFDIVPPDDLMQRMDEMRKVRNLAAHGRQDPSKNDVIKAVTAIEEYEHFLQKINKEDAKAKIIYHQENREIDKVINRTAPLIKAINEEKLN